MQNTDLSDFPPELIVKPLALIGISGLDTRNNAIHKCIWEALTNTRKESGPVAYKLIDNAYEFPVVKPKRTSYEWYIPKGILKRNWMDKHLHKIPAVVVIFYDLDWKDPQWNEKMIECASRVQSMRVALEGRGTRLAVVLIQMKQQVPMVDDPLETEYASALCASCELNLKSLFILPNADLVEGYALRLENAFQDLAQSYYLLEIKNIKMHREYLQKQNHQYLFVRHQFKMGFLNEMKLDLHTAHKHYTHAYNNLLEIRIVDTNALEIRMVAGFINYKLCRLMFALNLPRDAISQFKAHTERFKSRLGFQELAFEHHAWMSKQFNVFGDIFDEAVRLGLPAVQTQHPGLYYQQAVHHAILRKKSCEDLCKGVNIYPMPDPLEGMCNMEFYGQRPWRPGKVTSDPPDPQIESNGIKALQFLENQVNHSAQIIALYGLAVTQFKNYKCLRTRRFLIIQMADEYYHSGNYGQALTLWTHMLRDYREESWWSLLTDILHKALHCAFLTATVNEFVIISLELIGSKTTIPQTKKKQIFDNLNCVLRGQTPPHQAQDVSKTENRNATKLWQTALEEEKINVPLDITNIVSCVDCKARFLKDKYQADEKIVVEIYIRNLSEFILNFVGISLTVNTEDYCVDQSAFNNPSLLFNPREIKKYILEFPVNPTDINKESQINAVHLYLGTLEKVLVDLKLNGMGSGCGKNRTPPELMHFKYCGNAIDFDNVRPVLKTQIIPRHSRLSMVFEHDKPALLGEWYRIKIILKNERNCNVTNLQYEFNLIDDDGLDTTEFCCSVEKVPEKLPIIYSAEDLLPNQRNIRYLYMRCNAIGERNIKVKVAFNLANAEQIPSLMDEIIHVSVVKPFEITTRLLSALFEDVQKLYTDEDFVIMPVINCLSPWPVVIENTTLTFDPNVHNVDENIRSQVLGSELQNGESAAEMYLAVSKKRSDVPIALGQYSVQWRRVNGDSTTTQTNLTGLPVDWLPLEMKVSVPAHGLVRTPLLVEYHLTNKSHHLIQINVNVEGSEAFMFAGHKLFQMTILPSTTRVLKYNLYPLIAGSVSLPKLLLTIPENSTDGPALRQEHLNSLSQRTIPTHIYVMPQIKGDPEISSVIKEAMLLKM